MRLPITGGCACGALRYHSGAAAAVALNCHCRQCQFMSGGGHSSILVLLRENTIVKGDTHTWSYTADSGGRVTRHFCATCGTPVFSLLERHPLSIAVTAGSLDKPEDFKPTYALFTTEARPWDTISTDLRQLPAGLEQPPEH